MGSRTLLRLILLVEVAGIALVAWLFQRGGMAAWRALLAATAIAVLVRTVINLNNFVLAVLHASRTPDDFRLGPRACLSLLAGEWRASMVASHWHMARATVPGRIHPGAGGPPVLLLHGYGASAGYWVALAARLDAAGISHASVDLHPAAADIDSYAPQVEAAVDALRTATGADRVVIVAHSMGGLAARAWMRAAGTGKLARLVTLGTPHHGTALARFGPGANAAQMRREGGAPGAWLRALAAGESPATRALVTSLFTHHDNIVAPQTSSELPGARNLAFGGIGHVALGSDPRVLDAVMRELDAVKTGRDQA